MKLNLNEINYILCETIKLLTEITIKDAYSKYYFSLGEEFYTEILSRVQPEQKNVVLPITKWVLGVALKNPENVRENLDKLCNDEGNGILQIYQRLVTLDVLDEREKNIMNFKTIEAVEEITSRFDASDLWGNNNDRKKRILRSDFINAKNDVEFLYDDKIWLVVSPNSYEASCYWGHGTSWCTAYKDSRSYYDNYTSDGPLYININKKTGEKYQFHFPSSSFKDKSDSDISGDGNIFSIIKATKGLIDRYKEILPKEEFLCLNVGINQVLYENDYFSVVTTRLGSNNEVLNNGDTEMFESMPMTIISKDNNENMVREKYMPGFSNFFVINENEFLLTTQMKENDGQIEAFTLQVLTLEEIMEHGISYEVGKIWHWNPDDGWEYSYSNEDEEREYGDVSFVNEYPQFKSLVIKIMEYIGHEYDEINI